jgi:hypothetical protein
MASIVSKGRGDVDILIGADAAQATQYSTYMAKCAAGRTYVAQCSDGSLTLQDPEGQQFVLTGDQRLCAAPDQESEPGSPRCLVPDQAYKVPGLEELPPPEEALPPRLFVVYGNGDAEELIAEADAVHILNTAKADEQATVVEGEVMEKPLEGCRCHTIFSTQRLHGYVDPIAEPAGTVSLSMGSLDAECSLGTGGQPSSVQVIPTLTKYRQLIEYPGIDEDVRQKFQGTLKQYRKWEQAELAKNRAIMAGPEDKKGKAQEKKAAKKDDKKDKKGKNKKKRQSIEAAPVVIEEVMLPTFLEDADVPAVFVHAVDVLGIRQDLQPEPTNQQLLTKAISGREADATAVDEEAGDSPVPGEQEANLSPTADSGVDGVPPLPVQSMAAEEMPTEFESGNYSEDIRQQSIGDADDMPGSRSSRPKLADAPTFSFWKSAMGLQFLMDEGLLDPEQKPRIRKEKSLRQGPQANKRNPWNPMLLGEASEEDQRANEEEIEFVVEKGGHRDRSRTEAAAEEVAARMQHSQEASRDLRDMPYTPQQRLPIVSEDLDTPAGPHPDKKGNLWDIYGQPRQQRPVASHAYVMLNTDYLEKEGATDRRVRTSSISHKKNSAKAPSVSSVRKTGQHAVGTGSEIAAKDILGDLGVSNPEEHWKLTSTMQGLGDSNNLVEVTPGTCRFGPVRQGGVYRMHFFLRNLDVDVTRFSVGRIDPKSFVNVQYQPGHIAPGMAAKVTVEIVASAPGVVEQLVEARMKAHVVRIPVTARILEAEEYDRLDAESFVINRRHIGRHREKSDAGEKRAVEVVADEEYCKKVLKASGGSFLAAPPDFEDTPMRS